MTGVRPHVILVASGWGHEAASMSRAVMAQGAASVDSVHPDGLQEAWEAVRSTLRLWGDDPVVVSQVLSYRIPADFLEVLVSGVSERCASCLRGARFDVGQDGSPGPMATRYMRMPYDRRMASGDSGVEEVHRILPGSAWSCRASDLLAVSDRLSLGDTRSVSLAFASAGILVRVVDPPDSWFIGPRSSGGVRIAAKVCGRLDGLVPAVPAHAPDAPSGLRREGDAGDAVLINRLGRSGRLGNFLVLITLTYLHAMKYGIRRENVFFRRHASTHEGLVDYVGFTGREGKVISDYLEPNKDVLAPVWGSFVSDEELRRLERERRAAVYDNSVCVPVINEFYQSVLNAPAGFLSSLFYDEGVFARHRAGFPEYYSCDSVALHVRMTDFRILKTRMRRRFDPLGAATRIISRCAGKTVVVFSDDIEWCKANLEPPEGGRILFHDRQGPACDDLILMSCFRTVFRTEEISTYSLFASLLSRDLQATGRATWLTGGGGQAASRDRGGPPALHFITFATSNWKRAHARMRRDLGFIDSVLPLFKTADVLDEQSLDDAWYARYGRYAGEHGYAFWSWKPYIIRQKLESIGDGEVLVYMDGGCTLPVNDIVPFADDLERRCAVLSDERFVGCCAYTGPVKVWQVCSKVLRSHLGIGSDPGFCERFPHYESGILLIRKCKASMEFVERWNKVYDECYETAFHGPFRARAGEPSGFLFNNADQSSMQCLMYLGGVKPIDCNDLFYEKYKVYSRTKG